jgi:hypothetical protein
MTLPDRTTIRLEITDALYSALADDARDELRPLKTHLIYLLRQDLIRRGKLMPNGSIPPVVELIPRETDPII